MKKLLKITGIVLINVVVIALLLEVALRVAAPYLGGSVGVAARWAATGEPYAQDWQPAWQQNRDHWYILRPNIDNELQYGSPTVSFTVSTIELWDGGGVGFRTDPVDYFVDAVVVGDSFGFCFTERADCWVDLLAEQTALGIVNLSQPVTGSTSHYRILNDFGAPLEPGLVIWQFFGNDFNDDYGLAVYRDEIEPVASAVTAESSGEASSNWLLQNSALASVLDTIITGRIQGVPEGEALFTEPHQVQFGTGETLQFGAPYELQALDMTREENQIGYELSEAAFQQAADLVQNWGGELVVVVIPTREEVYAHLTEPVMGEAALNTLTGARQALLNGVCQEIESIRCFDPFDVLVEHAQNDEALYHVDDMHLNAQGNAVLAGALADWLDETGALDRAVNRRP